jgi:hypothetical protein
VTTKAPLAGKRLPLDRRIGAIEHAEHLVFSFQDALHRGCGKHKKGLKFAQVEEAHDGVNVRGREKDPSNWRVSLYIRLRIQFWSGENLRAQIRACGHQEPDSRVRIRRECDLRLRARATAQAAFAEAAAIGTRAIPLGKTAPGSGAEDLNAHADTNNTGGKNPKRKGKEPASESGRYKGLL